MEHFFLLVICLIAENMTFSILRWNHCKGNNFFLSQLLIIDYINHWLYQSKLPLKIHWNRRSDICSYLGRFWVYAQKNKKSQILKKVLYFRKFIFLALNEKTYHIFSKKAFLIFWEVEPFRKWNFLALRLKDIDIFPKMELSSLIVFLHFRKELFKLWNKKNALPKILIFQEMAISSYYIFSKKSSYISGRNLQTLKNKHF